MCKVDDDDDDDDDDGMMIPLLSPEKKFLAAPAKNSFSSLLSND